MDDTVQQTRESPVGWLAVGIGTVALMLGPIWLIVTLSLYNASPTWLWVGSRVPFHALYRAWIEPDPSNAPMWLGPWYDALAAVAVSTVGIVVPTVLVLAFAGVFAAAARMVRHNEDRAARVRYADLAGEVVLREDAWETDASGEQIVGG